MQLLNSNLMETLRRDQLELAFLFLGEPCQLALTHALGIPYLLVDLAGLTDETVVAAGMPWNLKAASSRRTPQSPTGNGPLARLFNGAQLLRETLCQTGWPWLPAAACARVRKVDGPVSRRFREDYEICKKFKPFFPHVSQVSVCLSSLLFRIRASNKVTV